MESNEITSVCSLRNAAKLYEINQHNHFIEPNDSTAFKAGANWQKEQDKAIIVELSAALKDIKKRCEIDDHEFNLPNVNEAITKAENHLK